MVVGVGLIGFVVAPVDHAYVVAPAPVKVAVAPAQMVIEFTVVKGEGFIVTVPVPVVEHPAKV